MPNSGLPTLEDVANGAGVSTATVSRCINLPDKVKPHTREKVLKVIEELGYTPNFSAKALASNKTGTIGALVPTMDNAIFARGLQAFQETLAASEITLLVSSSNYSQDQETRNVKSLVSRGIDGLMLIGTERSSEIYELLHKRKIPYVIAWSYRKDLEHNCVGFDNEKAAFDLARHVMQHGHRKIAMIAGVTIGNDRAADRIKGVKHAIMRATNNAELLSVVEKPYSIEDGEQGFAEVFSAGPLPTAIICGNDVLAAGAISKAKEMGLAVPEDISIVGFDNIDLALVTDPKLTTINVPHRRMGSIAAELLISSLNGKNDLQRTEIETDVIERESLANCF